jgi:hypothetical protein
MVALPRRGTEYIRWPILSELPEDVTAMEVSVDGEVTWHPAAVVTIDGKKYLRAQFRGSLDTTNPAGAITLTWIANKFNRYEPVARLIDNPEVVIRGGGVIDVV